MAEVVEESYQTEVHRKTVRTSYKIEEVSTEWTDDDNALGPKMELCFDNLRNEQQTNDKSRKMYRHSNVAYAQIHSRAHNTTHVGCVWSRDDQYMLLL